MFVDFVKIYIKAGDGGDGAISFHREKYLPFGGPDGGDGGNGGDVVFLADDDLNTLSKFRYKRKFIAQNGENGKKNNCSGKNGEDVIIKVPKGTIIKNLETGMVVADVCFKEPIVVAKGGRGGWGNRRFKSSTRQSPSFSKPGLLGEELNLSLELKLLADVGLVGLPNAGKSSLVSAISSARPKVGNYQFTTLVPCLGVVNFSEDSSFVVADIPGLIEGASKGKGLGHTFLKHLQRCRLLLHLVDVSLDDDTADPIKNIKIIDDELFKFDEKLRQKKQILVASKIDVVSEKKLNAVKKYAKENDLMFFEISSYAKIGLNLLIKKLGEELTKIPNESFNDKLDFLYVKDKSFRSVFEVEKKDGIFYVSARWLLKILNTIDMQHFENLVYLQKVIKKSGIEKKLKEMNIKEGDVVNIEGYVFEYKE